MRLILSAEMPEIGEDHVPRNEIEAYIATLVTTLVHADDALGVTSRLEESG